MQSKVYFSRKTRLSEEDNLKRNKNGLPSMRSRLLNQLFSSMRWLAFTTGNSGTCLCGFQRHRFWLKLSTVMMSNAEINVLSAGAVQPGIVKVIEHSERKPAHRVKITFATAPIILKRIDAPDGLDVVIAPPAVLDEWVKAAKTTAADRVTIGRIGVGVMVRDSTPLPRITTVDDFKQALLSAESVVYNQASTGIYLEKLFERLGIAEHLKTKTVRYPDAAAVLEHIGKGKGGEIGLGATTVIIEGGTKDSNSSGRYRQKFKTTRLTPPPS